jgi:hypothetical protein
MGKGDTHHDDPRADASGAGEPTSVFDAPATIREPAAPRTFQEAQEATDALLREILEGEPEDTSEPLREARGEPSFDEDEDWPEELHPLHL